MGFLGDFFGDGELADVIVGGKADIADLGGQQAEDEEREAKESQERAANDALTETQRATLEAQGFLAPFGDIGLRGVEQSSFLANPDEQFEFLKNHPLFNLALENANRSTNASAASTGRFNSGDTLERLSNNVLLSASPLIDKQRQDIGNLLNIGTGIATTQANTAIGEGSNVSRLLTDIGNVQAAGAIAAGNRRDNTTNNALQIAGAIYGASDSRLKDNAEIVGDENGFKVWSWNWNELAKDTFGLEGQSSGVMFSEVLEKAPQATAYKDGFGLVNYKMIGVHNGN